MPNGFAKLRKATTMSLALEAADPLAIVVAELRGDLACGLLAPDRVGIALFVERPRAATRKRALRPRNCERRRVGELLSSSSQGRQCASGAISMALTIG